jgi:hypothetical protein
MVAAFKYLGEVTDRFFATHMQRAAHRISAGVQLFPH